MFKLLFIPDKMLLALSGDIDTYIYLLFLRMMTYLMALFMVIDCTILLPLYQVEGTTA
jgi:hypothetical protein